MKICSGVFLSLMVLFVCSTSAKAQTGSSHNYEKRLKDLNIVLSKPAAPTANFIKSVRVGNIVYLSGHGPDTPGGGHIVGKVGSDLTLEQAKDAARLVCISLLSSLKAEIGDLNKVKRVFKVFGMVNCVPSFTQQSQVINGCSDLLVEIFGENGKHVRSAVGMSSLPANIPVEIEMEVEVAE